MLNIKDIDVKYRTALKGTYNRGVFVCPYCENDMLKTLYDNVIGFSSINYGVAIIIECTACFERFWFHANSKEFYDTFLDGIRLGNNHHFISIE